MAQRTIQANFKRFLTQNYKKIGYLAGLGDDVVFDLQMGGTDFINGVRNGMEPILKAHGLGPAMNTVKLWRQVVKRTTAVIKRTKQLDKVKLQEWTRNTKAPGIYLVKSKSTQTTIFIRLVRKKVGNSYKTGDNRIQQVATAYRNIAYRMWIKEAEGVLKEIATAGGQYAGALDPKWEQVEGVDFSEKIAYESKTRGSTEKTVQNIIAQNTNVAHREGTTKADLAVKGLKESNPSLSTELDISVFDILDYAEQNLNVTFYKNEKKKRVGSYSFGTLVEARLAYNEPGSEDSDKKATVNKFELAVQKFINDAISDPNNKWHKALTGVDSVASKTPRKRITDDVVEDLIKPALKTKKAKRKGSKKPTFKNEKRTIVAKKGKKTPATRRMTQTVNAAGVVGRPQKRKRQETSSISQIRSLINKRLPAEVRRNMGRPALINRTGNFSNSVQLLSVNQANTGLTGDYTYTKTGGGSRPPQPGVYQTFENSGRWPAGYNPKDLITKSIRNLAIQYTEQKFVQLRRQ